MALVSIKAVCKLSDELINIQLNQTMREFALSWIQTLPEIMEQNDFTISYQKIVIRPDLVEKIETKEVIEKYKDAVAYNVMQNIIHYAVRSNKCFMFGSYWMNSIILMGFYFNHTDLLKQVIRSGPCQTKWLYIIETIITQWTLKRRPLVQLVDKVHEEFLAEGMRIAKPKLDGYLRNKNEYNAAVTIFQGFFNRSLIAWKSQTNEKYHMKNFAKTLFNHCEGEALDKFLHESMGEGVDIIDLPKKAIEFIDEQIPIVVEPCTPPVTISAPSFPPPPPKKRRKKNTA